MLQADRLICKKSRVVLPSPGNKNTRYFFKTWYNNTTQATRNNTLPADAGSM